MCVAVSGKYDHAIYQVDSVSVNQENEKNHQT